MSRVYIDEFAEYADAHKQEYEATSLRRPTILEFGGVLYGKEGYEPYMMCKGCGAVVGDTALHDEFHLKTRSAV